MDDTSAIEKLPRNSISLLNSIVSDILKFSMDHSMRLNPIKYKEMLINFMLYPNLTLRLLVVGNNGIERVSTYKILGVFIHSDLKLNSHVDYIYKTACKKLYFIRILRRAGVDLGSLLEVYKSSVRSVLEYAVPVWQSIPGYLSDKIESIQKRALKIIFPCADSYSDALQLAQEETLVCRRDKICKEYMCKIEDLNHPLRPPPPTRLDDTCPCTPRRISDQLYFYKNVPTCRTKRTEDVFTLK